MFLLNESTIKSILEGGDPLKSSLERTKFSIKLKLRYFFFFCTNFLLKNMLASQPEYFIHRMFYVRQDDIFMLRKNLWLIFNQTLPFIIKKNDNYHSNMKYNTKKTTRARRCALRKFLEKNFYYMALLGFWKASRLKQKILKKQAEEYVAKYHQNEGKINESIKQ